MSHVCFAIIKGFCGVKWFNLKSYWCKDFDIYNVCQWVSRTLSVNVPGYFLILFASTLQTSVLASTVLFLVERTVEQAPSVEGILAVVRYLEIYECMFHWVLQLASLRFVARYYKGWCCNSMESPNQTMIRSFVPHFNILQHITPHCIDKIYMSKPTASPLFRTVDILHI